MIEWIIFGVIILVISEVFFYLFCDGHEEDWVYLKVFSLLVTFKLLKVL